MSILALKRHVHVQDHQGTGVKAVVKRSPYWTYRWQCAKCSFAVQMQMDARKDGLERVHEILKKRIDKLAMDHSLQDHTIGDKRNQ